ncbi:MAG TPA: hypothetical protein VI142_03825 [Gaiellaceae bacterium]
MALLLILIALLGFGFFTFGSGSGSTGAGSAPQRYTPHRVKCSARMKAQMTAGESRRRCGSPPANP